MPGDGSIGSQRTEPEISGGETGTDHKHSNSFRVRVRCEASEKSVQRVLANAKISTGLNLPFMMFSGTSIWATPAGPMGGSRFMSWRDEMHAVVDHPPAQAQGVPSVMPNALSTPSAASLEAMSPPPVTLAISLPSRLDELMRG